MAQPGDRRRGGGRSKRNPGLASAYAERATAYFGLGQYQKAIDDDTRAIDNDPRSAKAFNDRAVAYAALGDFNGAMSDLQHAQLLDSDNPDRRGQRQDGRRREAGPDGSAAAPAVPADLHLRRPWSPRPRLTFTRPQLDPVSEVTPPARFCTAVDRNKFMDEVYSPAQDTAKKDGEKATQYQAQLLQLYNKRLKEANDGSHDIDDIRSETEAYAPIAGQAWPTRHGLD